MSAFEGFFVLALVILVGLPIAAFFFMLSMGLVFAALTWVFDKLGFNI